ncbi:hypothetical protein HDU79_007671 [Rhizoclosmatium sp. JEL0117]|nr:hypothetical protein HDU79_007671 [Rhizoclosmatium sp. JEL0117]
MQNQSTSPPNFDHVITVVGAITSICFTPIVGSLGFCCIDESNVIFRTSYGRGIGIGYILWGIALIALAIALYLQLYFTSAIGLGSWVLVPIGTAFILIGLVLFRNARLVLNGRVQPRNQVTTVVVIGGQNASPCGGTPMVQQSFRPPSPYDQPQFQQPYRAPSPVFLQQNGMVAAYPYSQQFVQQPPPPPPPQYTTYPQYAPPTAPPAPLQPYVPPPNQYQS